MTLFCNKKLSALLHRITSKKKGDFLFKMSSFFFSHEKVCKNKDFSGIVMPSKYQDNI